VSHAEFVTRGVNAIGVDDSAAMLRAVPAAAAVGLAAPIRKWTCGRSLSPGFDIILCPYCSSTT
jgi:hypothetical protein